MYCGSIIPVTPKGVKVDARGISINYEAALPHSGFHGSGWTPRRGVSALEWLYCMEHLRRGEVAAVLHSGHTTAVRFARLSAHRALLRMVATHTRTHTRAPRTRATRRTRRACRVEAPPGGDDAGSSDLPPAPTWGHPSCNPAVSFPSTKSPWRLPSGLRALLAYALLEVDA